MRNRNSVINIRVSEKEKKTLESIAVKCGLSLSAYMRQAALGKEVCLAAPEELFEGYDGIMQLARSWETLPKDEVDRLFDRILLQLRDAYGRFTLRDDRGGH